MGTQVWCCSVVVHARHSNEDICTQCERSSIVLYQLTRGGPAAKNYFLLKKLITACFAFCHLTRTAVELFLLDEQEGSQLCQKLSGLALTNWPFPLFSCDSFNSSLWETAAPLLSSHIASPALYWVPGQGLDFGSTCDLAIRMICGLLQRAASELSECYPTIRSALFTIWKWAILTKNPGTVKGLMWINRWRRGIWLGPWDSLCWSKWGSKLLWTFQIGFEEVFLQSSWVECLFI